MRRHPRSEYRLQWARTPRGRFIDQRKAAKQRGIDWQLTFEQWWTLWEPFWANRGMCSSCYVMARNGDVGPYSVDNVHIVTAKENLAERRPRIGSEATRAKLNETDIERMKDLRAAGLLQREIADYFNVARTTVGAALRGDNWGHL